LGAFALPGFFCFRKIAISGAATRKMGLPLREYFKKKSFGWISFVPAALACA